MVRNLYWILQNNLKHFRFLSVKAVFVKQGSADYLHCGKQSLVVKMNKICSEDCKQNETFREWDWLAWGISYRMPCIRMTFLCVCVLSDAWKCKTNRFHADACTLKVIWLCVVNGSIRVYFVAQTLIIHDGVLCVCVCARCAKHENIVVSM